MSRTEDAIVKALTGLKSSITRAEIVERTGLGSRDVGGYMHKLITAGVIRKHPGPTQRTTGYTLNPDHAPDVVRVRKARPSPTPKSIKEVAQRAIERANGGDLVHRHVMTTLGLLVTAIELAVDDEDVLNALAVHQEAVQIAQESAGRAQ